ADVAVEAVDADVQLAADEPLRVRRGPLEDLVPGLDPLELAGEFRPEAFGGFVRALVDRRVGDVRRFCELGRRGELAVLFQERVDLGVGLVGHSSPLYIGLRASGYGLRAWSLSKRRAFVRRLLGVVV